MSDPDRDPPSEVELGNVALGHLGCRPITSFTDGTAEANAVRLHYYNARDELIQSYIWDFCIANVAIAADVTPPVFDRANKFPLPADWMRTLRPFPESNTYSIDWIVQAGAIYTNQEAPLNLRYVAQINDATRFSPLFRKALALDLAAKMSEALTQSEKKKDSLLAQYKDAINEAKRVQAIQAVPAEQPTDEWLLARDSDLGWPNVQ